MERLEGLLKSKRWARFYLMMVRPMVPPDDEDKEK